MIQPVIVGPFGNEFSEKEIQNFVDKHWEMRAIIIGQRVEIRDLNKRLEAVVTEKNKRQAVAWGCLVIATFALGLAGYLEHKDNQSIHTMKQFNDRLDKQVLTITQGK